MNKHTPGPWTWERLVETDDLPRVPEFTLKGPDVLCRYWHDNPPSADALLLKAAPDMFAMLQKVAAHFQDTNAPLGEEVLAVIARAEGDMP